MRFRLVLLSISISLLTACSGASHSDLEAFTEEVQRTPAPPVKPAPELPELARVAYTGRDVRDPFVSTPVQARAIDNIGGDCPQPDLNRRRGELEGLALDQLTLSGTLKSANNVYSALLISNTGRLYRVERGDYIGLNRGEVIQITPQQVLLREWISTGDGCWQRRDSTLQLLNSQGSSDS
ncbi:MAG TPA: pilus assembly protein PilP [Pseudidiomarina sp.]|nr:pilus assembly protein PilP [Pseudidiomarina sp.]